MSEGRTALGRGDPRRPRRIEVALFALVLGTFGYFYNGYGWNQTARYDSIWAFVEPGPNRGTVRIDDFLSDPEAGLNTGDWARSPEEGEHFYSNKAPGTSFLGIPFYWALFHVERAVGFDPLSVEAVLVNAWLIHLWVTVLPVAISSLFFFRLLLHLGAGERRAFGLAAVLYLGTLMLPFSTMLWGHTTAAAFVVMAVSCFVAGGAGGVLAAGFLAGAAVLTDYGTAFVAVSLPVLALTVEGRRKDALRVVAGGFVPFVVFLAYNDALFGSPFRLAAAYAQPFMMERGGMVGLLGNLRSGALWGLTFGRARGLFVYMPVLLLVVFAIRRIRGHPREEYAWFALANILVVFFANLAFNGWWWGGVNAGARYQIVALPFWVSLLVLLPPGGRLRSGLMFLTAVSLANMLVIAAVSPMAPDALRGSPLLFAWAKLIGVVRLDLGLDTLVASGGSLSRGSLHIYPTFLMRDWPIRLQDGRIADWAVFNLGERLLGLRGSVSLVPVLAWIGVFTSLGLRAPVPESEASDTEP